QQAQTASIVRPRFDEIVAPDVIAMLRPQSNAGAVVKPQPNAWLVLGGLFQSFPPPGALHSVLSHFPSGRLQQSGDSSITEAPILTGQRQDRLGKPILVVALGWPIAVCSPPLPNDSAGVPFSQAFVPRVLNGEAS